MDWSPHTLNLNIIEALLDHLDKELNKRQQACLLKLQESLNERVQAVLRMPNNLVRFKGLIQSLILPCILYFLF